MIKLKITPKNLGFGLCIISLFLFLFTIYLAFKTRFASFDEVFTLSLIKYPFFDILYLTGLDVHPPLYYLLLKVIFQFFSFINISFTESFLGRIVSILAMFAFLIFSLTKLRKRFGILASGIFLFCVLSMPHFLLNALYIRMYYLPLLFVTLSFFYAYEITINPNWKNWGLLIIFSILASYTTYFAAINCIIIFLLLFIWIYFNNRIELKKWLTSVIILILLYLPWIVWLISINGLDANFKLPPITFEKIQSYLWYIFSSSHHFYWDSYLLTVGNHTVNTPNTIFDTIYNISLFGALLLIVTIVLFLYSFNIQKKYKNFFSKGILVLIFTIGIGIIFSILFEPIFFDRHMFSALGCFWIVFSVFLSKLYSKKRIFIPILLILLLVGANSTVNFVNDESYNEKALAEITTVLDKITTNDLVIMADDNFVTTFFTASFNRHILNDKNISINAYLKNSDNWELENLKNITIYKTLGNVPDQKPKFYLYGYENYNDLVKKIGETIKRNSTVYFFSKEYYNMENFKEIIPNYKIKNLQNFTKSLTDTPLIEKVYIIY
jgi:hypothetical protein